MAEFDPVTFQYINFDDNQVRDISFDATEFSILAFSALITNFYNGALNEDEFIREGQEAIEQEYLRQYTLGIGGQSQMTDSDIALIATLVGTQLPFLFNFASRITNDEMTQAQATNWGRGYMLSGRQAFERSNFTRNTRMNVGGCPDLDLSLPAYPGDGTSICLCLTDTTDRILVRDKGWVEFRDLSIGMEVLTHQYNWKPITAIITKALPKPSENHLLRGRFGEVSATKEHLWYTVNRKWRNNLPRKTHNVTPCDILSNPNLASYKEFKLSEYDLGFNAKAFTNALYTGQLKAGTEVYDLEVADDHSFCVEGFFAHNSYCKCFWTYVFESGCMIGANWNLNEARHCNTCLSRSSNWKPYLFPVRNV